MRIQRFTEFTEGQRGEASRCGRQPGLVRGARLQSRLHPRGGAHVVRTWTELRMRPGGWAGREQRSRKLWLEVSGLMRSTLRRGEAPTVQEVGTRACPRPARRSPVLHPHYPGGLCPLPFPASRPCPLLPSRASWALPCPPFVARAPCAGLLPKLRG